MHAYKIIEDMLKKRWKKEYSISDTKQNQKKPNTF